MQQSDRIIAQDASRVHLGDNYTTDNSCPSHSRDAHNPSSKSICKLLEPDSLDELLDQLCDALGFLRMKERSANVATDHADTCKWVFKKHQFLKRQNPDLLPRHYGFLWIKGIPGAGKSKIIKSAARTAKEEAGAGHTIL